MALISDILSAEDRARFVQMYKKEWVKAYDCMNPRCTEKVKGRRNHLLQENGILNFVSKENKLYLHELDAFRGAVGFKNTTKNKCMRANILCPNCDNKVFSNIEKRDIDFRSINTFYLLSLRSLIWERRKNEFYYSLYSKCLRSLDNQEFINKIRKKRERVKAFIDAEKIYEHQYFKVSHPKLIDYKIRYKFRFIPKIEVALSSHIGVILDKEKEYSSHRYFIHIIPMETKSVLMIGTDIDKHNWISSSGAMEGNGGTFIDRVYSNFFKYDNRMLEFYISFFMLAMCEDWVCSEKFYLERIEPREKQVLSFMRSSYNNLDKFFIPNKSLENNTRVNLFKV